MLIIPTLLLVSLFIFFLSKEVPQDQVESVMLLRGVDRENDVFPQESYTRIYKELGLDKPQFYFSVLPHFYPDNIHAISKSDVKDFVEVQLEQNRPFESIEAFVSEYYQQKKSNPELSLLSSFTDGASKDAWPSELRGAYNSMQQSQAGFYVPKIIWHGFDNQYHNWLSSFFKGGFGISLLDGNTALAKVGKALAWTLSITLIDLLISLPLGILLGYFLARNPSGRRESLMTQFFYMIYAIPLFWLATMLIVFFTTDDYGAFTNIFPSVGIDIYPGKGTAYHILHNLDKMILPIFCLVIHSLAYTSRFVRRSILNEMQRDYIMTAYSKGLTKDQVLRKHALPNALIPVITILVAMIPAAFASSLVLEVIFNIPGIGRLLFRSIEMADWNVSFCIMMIIAFVTVISYLLGDILYALVNPKIRLK